MQRNQTYHNYFGYIPCRFIENQILSGIIHKGPLFRKNVDLRNDLCSNTSGLDPTTDYR
jgi:hypothetical protein